MKNLTIFMAMALAIVLAFAGCTVGSATAETTSAQKISPENAREMMNTSGVILFDVRTQNEYDAGHIDSAILLPYDTIAANSPGLPADKNTAVMVYCRSGSRSSVATTALFDLGYTHVYDLGGIQSWPYEIVK